MASKQARKGGGGSAAAEGLSGELARTTGEGSAPPKKASGKTRRSSKAAAKGAPKSAPPSPMPPSGRESRRAIAYLLTLGFCGLTLLSLLSYSPRDPSFSSRSSSQEIANWCGRVGAVISDVLFQLLGWGAWAILPLGIWLCLRFLRRPAGNMARLLIGLFGTFWASSLFGLLFFTDPVKGFHPGGFVGKTTAAFLLTNLGPAGSYLVVGLALLSVITATFSIDWEAIAGRSVDAAAQATPIAGQWMLDTTRRAAGAGWGVASQTWDRLRSRPVYLKLEEEDDEDMDSEDMAEEDSVDSPLAIPIDPEPALDPDHTHHVFNAAAPLEKEVPTVVAARHLVEVEYVPTGIVPSVGMFSEAVAPRQDPRDAPDPISLPPSAPSEPAPPPPAPAPRREERIAAIVPGFLESGGEEPPPPPRRKLPEHRSFEKPDFELLDFHEKSVAEIDEAELKEMAKALEEKLSDFKIEGEVTSIQPGPVITIFEFLPAPGVKLSRIAALTDDIAMALRAVRVRIVAPIPGRGVVGFELPNKKRQMVWYRDLMVSKSYREGEWILPMCLGKTVEGKPYLADLAKMPHLLVGGTTGSGKSVGVNAMLLTLLYHCSPEELRLILIDPKMLEFELYSDIPHLLHPVVTEPKLAAAALKWACTEMDNRYRLLARWGTRNIASYNEKVEKELSDWTPEKARRYAPRDLEEGEEAPLPRKLPYIVIVIDELADLMMIAAKEVEESIVRLAQKARACGIHLIVATQRPSVDVITGLIKANMPCRIAYQVRSKIDGRTILDQNGAETLLGKGDLLLLPPGVSALTRLHGPFVSDQEVQAVADFLREQAEPDYSGVDIRLEDEGDGEELGEGEYDEFYDMAVQIVTEAGKASTSMIQRRLKIGYNRAARIIERMERDGLIGPADGARPREVLSAR